MRENVSKRLKARQMCVDDDDECNLEKTPLINSTGHLIMQGTPNPNYGLRSRTSNAINKWITQRKKLTDILRFSNLLINHHLWNKKNNSFAKTVKLVIFFLLIKVITTVRNVCYPRVMFLVITINRSMKDFTFEKNPLIKESITIRTRLKKWGTSLH